MLAIVATPIGNLEDLTLRAARTLREADLIACEDTRQTRKLLDHYGISKPLVSYHEHNERERAAELLEQLAQGRRIALVSDAGTPLIADPGYRLVEQARERGFEVTPIPGPSALIAALSASGLPTDAFLFHGFLPAKTTARRALLEQLKALPATLVFYETPHRILGALQDIADILGLRTVALGREITKTYEEFLTGTAAQLHEKLAARPSIKGEFVVMIAKGEARPEESSSIEDAVAQLVSQGVPRMDALKQVARRRGLSKREVYKTLQG